MRTSLFEYCLNITYYLQITSLIFHKHAMGVSERASLTFTKIPPGITGMQECRFGCELKFSHTYHHGNYYGILHVLLLFEQANLSFTTVL